MSGRGVDGERGNMLPLVVVSALVLFVVVAFAIDQSAAYVAKTRQENVLDTARAACMDASFALAAKNSENPGWDVAELVAETVRRDGFEGRATVWFFEAPADRVPESERLWAIGIQLEDRAPTVFARGFGVESLPVASHRVVIAVPYASEQAWRPEHVMCGRFEIAEGRGASIAFFSIDGLDGFPAELSAEARSALPEGLR